MGGTGARRYGVEASTPELEQRLRRIEQVLVMKADANSYVDDPSAANRNVPLVTNVSVTKDINKWALTWDPVDMPDLRKYEILVASDQNFSTIIGSFDETEVGFTYPAADADIDYYVKVRAMNKDKWTGPWSSGLSVQTGLVTTGDIEPNAVTQFVEWAQAPAAPVSSGGNGVIVGGPPITSRKLTSGLDDTFQFVYTTASISPGTDRTVLVSILTGSNNLPVPVPVLTGGGMASWTLVNSSPFDRSAGIHRDLHVYRSSSSTPGSGAVTITFTGQQPGGCMWSIFDFGNTDTTTNDGVVQSEHNEATATTLTVTLGAFSGTGNATFGAFASIHKAAMTPGSGFTETHEQWGIYHTLYNEFKFTNDTSVDATALVSSKMGGIAIELAVTPVIPPAPDAETYGPLVISTSSGSIVMPYIMVDIEYQSVYGYKTAPDISPGDFPVNKLDVVINRRPVGGGDTELMSMTFDFHSSVPYNYVLWWGGSAPATVITVPKGHTCRARLHMPVLVDQPGAGTFEYRIVITATGEWNTYIYCLPTTLRMRFFEYKV